MKLIILAIACLLEQIFAATLDIDNNVIPAVEKGFPVRHSTKNAAEMINGKKECILDKARLKYFEFPDGRYIKHCDCWKPMLQPNLTSRIQGMGNFTKHFREDWIEVNLWEPKLVREVVVQGCTDFERRWVSSFKVQYTYDGLVWTWLGQRNRGTEFKA